MRLEKAETRAPPASSRNTCRRSPVRRGGTESGAARLGQKPQRRGHAATRCMQRAGQAGFGAGANLVGPVAVAHAAVVDARLAAADPLAVPPPPAEALSVAPLRTETPRHPRGITPQEKRGRTGPSCSAHREGKGKGRPAKDPWRRGARRALSLLPPSHTPQSSSTAGPPHCPRQSSSTLLKQTPSHPLSALPPPHTPAARVSGTPDVRETGRSTRQRSAPHTRGLKFLLLCYR